MQLEGVIPPMPSPIADADVATEVLKSHTEFLCEAGVHGLFPCGSTGEFTALTPEQRETVVETVCEAADGVPVLAGCGANSVPVVSDYVQHAASAGADAAVVVTPYYATTSQEGLEMFFTRIADAAPIPVIIYEIPALTGQRLTPDTIGKIAEHNSIIGLKDSTGDLRRLLTIVDSTPSDFDVLQGSTELAIATLDIGGDGIVAGPANIYPSAAVDLYEAHRDGERDTATRIANTVTNPVVKACDPVPLAAAIKHLLKRKGFDAGPPLPPFAPLDDDACDRLDRCYDRIGDRPSLSA
jgi:4-hydroxy-tetrahydrodipicolinate synthase